MESILTLIKKRVGIAEDDEHFDDDVLMEINTAIMTLTQLGVGPSEGFVVKDTNFIIGTGPIAMTASYSLPASNNCFNLSVVNPFSL